jgi:hypothetical protein
MIEISLSAKSKEILKYIKEAKAHPSKTASIETPVEMGEKAVCPFFSFSVSRYRDPPAT